jgi:excisionase family DNA binding protein
LENVLDFAGLMRVLGISHPTARKLIRGGQIKAVRAGRKHRILESVVMDFLRGGETVVDGEGKAEGQRQTT